MKEWLYGKHAVEEALRAGRRRFYRLVLAASEKREDDAWLRSIEGLARDRKVALERLPAVKLDALTGAGHHHQGIAAEASPFIYGNVGELGALCCTEGPRACVVVLDTIQDPQNFGTLLRTAEAAGVTGVIILDRRQVDVTPAVSNASAGAVEHLMVVRVNNLARTIQDLQALGLWVYALQAEAGAVRYSEADLKGPLGLVIGSEGRGVSRLVRERCDGALAIPMYGKVESLNAAVAGSIVLYEAVRQRNKA